MVVDLSEPTLCISAYNQATTSSGLEGLQSVLESWDVGDKAIMLAGDVNASHEAWDSLHAYKRRSRWTSLQ